MKKKLFLIAALAVAAAVAAWYVLRMDQGDGMAYLTEPVTIGNITRTVNATGEVGAVQLVSVGAQVGGQIKKLHVVLGQDVKKGDLIAEIDSVPQLNQLETDKARLQSYESQLAAKKVALKIAKTKYDREMQLKKRDAASKESLEDAENAYALAKAEVTELESQIRQARRSTGPSFPCPWTKARPSTPIRPRPPSSRSRIWTRWKSRSKSPRATLRRSSRVCPSPIPSFPIPRRNTRPP